MSIEIDLTKDIFKSTTDPTNVTNLKLGDTWINTITGEEFICINSSTNLNKWVGQLGTNILSVLDVVDIFRDGSGVALYQMDGTSSDTGGNYDGSLAENGTFVDGKYGKAIQSDGNNQQVIIDLDYNDDIITVAFWFKWSGTSRVMPIGFGEYDFYIPDQDICGFNTNNTDRYGIDNPFNTDDWFHLVMEFHDGNVEDNKLWINSVAQSLEYKSDHNQNSNNASIKHKKFHIFGWGYDSNYRDCGLIDQVRIFNRSLTSDEVNTLYNEN